MVLDLFRVWILFLNFDTEGLLKWNTVLQISRMSLIQVDLTFYMWLFFIVSQWLFQQEENTSRQTSNSKHREHVCIWEATRHSAPSCQLPQFRPGVAMLAAALLLASIRLATPSPFNCPAFEPFRCPTEQRCIAIQVSIRNVISCLSNLPSARKYHQTPHMKFFFATTNNNLSLIIIARLLETSFLLHIRYATIISTLYNSTSIYLRI